MRMFSFIAKARRKVFVQTDPKCRRAQEQPSAAKIQKRVHVAFGEEVLQSDIAEERVHIGQKREVLHAATSPFPQPANSTG